MVNPKEPEIRTRILVREVMSSPVITAGPNENIANIASKMVESNVGSVIILSNSDDEPLGIITEGDLVKKVVSKNLLPEKVRAKDIVTKPLQMVDAEKDLVEAAKMMRKHRIKRLGVSYKGKLVGIVSMSDLIGVTPELMEILSEKAKIVLGEVRKQRGYVAGYCDLCNQWSDFLLEMDGKFLCEECRAET
ncbi:MAG: CBS domain-containing protein [Nitrososphaerales archaeon]